MTIDVNQARRQKSDPNIGQTVMQKDFHYDVIYALAKEAGKG